MPDRSSLLADEKAPPGCTCGYRKFDLSGPRFHTYECQLRTGMNIGQALRWVTRELEKARGKFPAFNSPHEGKAVIEEELDELWQHVKANTGTTDEALEEAIQVAAMALRYVVDLSEGRPVHRG